MLCASKEKKFLRVSLYAILANKQMLGKFQAFCGVKYETCESTEAERQLYLHIKQRPMTPRSLVFTKPTKNLLVHISYKRLRPECLLSLLYIDLYTVDILTTTVKTLVPLLRSMLQMCLK